MGARADNEIPRMTGMASVPQCLGGSVPDTGTLPPLGIDIDPSEGRVLVRDRDELFGYELWFRPRRGVLGLPGWMELSFDLETGDPIQTAVPTSEVMAVARDAGLDGQVAAMTAALASWFERGGHSACHRIAATLRREVQAGRERERLSLRAIQARLIELIVAGESLTVMCERGGFVSKHGRGDTSWLLRRAGLMRVRCSRTGKVRVARTASYNVFCQLVAAADASPHEFGA